MATFISEKSGLKIVIVPLNKAGVGKSIKFVNGKYITENTDEINFLEKKMRQGEAIHRIDAASTELNKIRQAMQAVKEEDPKPTTVVEKAKTFKRVK